MGNGDVVAGFEPNARISGAGQEGGSRSYVVVEAGPEMLSVYQYGLGLGKDGGPVSLKKHRKYEMRADEFRARIPEMERELGAGYSDWKFRPGQGALGSCGEHLKF